MQNGESGRTYSLQGCTCRLGRCGFSIVQKRWLLVHYFGKIFKIELVSYCLWIVMWGILFLFGWLAFHHSDPNPFEPGNVMFDLSLLTGISYIFGNILSSLIGLPPLFGFMIIGMVVRNVKSDPTLTAGIPDHLSSVVKEIALTIIVGRAGLGFPINTFLGDIREIRCRVITADGEIEWREQGKFSRFMDSLKKLKTGLLLAVTPMTCEAVAYMGMAIVIFKFDVIWGFLLGFIMAAVSPAVVVPGLIDLQSRGFTGTGGTVPVPSIVMFASGLDDVFAITFFGIFFGMAFGGGPIAEKVIKAPLEILGGIVAGFILGYVLYRIAIRFLPKEYDITGLTQYGQKTAQDNDMAVFGITHPVDPYQTSEMRMPAATRSHELVFLIVFLACVCFVVGFASIKIGTAGTLESMGVLGAMSTCFAINYFFSQCAFHLTSVENDNRLMTWCVESHAQLDSDRATRAFFKLRPGESLITKLKENSVLIEDLTRTTKTSAAAMAELNLRFKVVWDLFACPLLFSMVGSSIDLGEMADPDLLWKAFLTISVALCARCLGAYIACAGSGWNVKNKLFVAFAWMPKATVQAAVGGLALAEAEKLKSSACVALAPLAQGATAAPCPHDQDVDWARTILQVSVLGIILTAPLGAAAIAILGPRWLEQAEIETPKEATVAAADSHYRDAKRRLQNSIISVGEMDHFGVVDFTRNLHADINSTALPTGHRPEHRQRFRVKRAASFPASLALSNPQARDVARLNSDSEHLQFLNAQQDAALSPQTLHLRTRSLDMRSVSIAIPEVRDAPPQPPDQSDLNLRLGLGPNPLADRRLTDPVVLDAQFQSAADYSDAEVVSSVGDATPSP